MVYLTLFSIVKNETEAEDGAQETVISAYRHLASFRGDAKFSTWLVTIAINEGRKRLRKAKTAAEESIEEKWRRMRDYSPAPLTIGGDSAGSPGTEGTAGSAASRRDGAARHLPASIYLERLARTQRGGNGAGAGNKSWRSESAAAPGPDDAAKAPGSIPENDAPARRLFFGRAL